MKILFVSYKGKHGRKNYRVMVDNLTHKALGGKELYANHNFIGQIKSFNIWHEGRLQSLHSFVLKKIYKINPTTKQDRINHVDTDPCNNLRSNLEWSNAVKNGMGSRRIPKPVYDRSCNTWRVQFSVLANQVHKVLEKSKELGLNGGISYQSPKYKAASATREDAQRIIKSLLPIAQKGASIVAR
jgi:hypothetical protein